MSEYDEPGRSGDSGDPGEPAYPDEAHEDTRPLWEPRGPGQPEHDQGEQQAGQPGDRPGHHQHAPYQPPPYQPYGPGYGQGSPHQTMPLPGYYPQQMPQQPRSRVPGWIWPVVAATALVVGLLGGTLGGAAVTSSMSDDTSSVLPPLPGSEPASPPLDPDNRSVAAVAQQLLPSTVQILAQQEEGENRGATGSGFVLDRNGHVVTNNHVVAGAAGSGDIEVIDQSGRTHAAEIVGRSPVYDIAVLEVEDARRLRPAAIGSSKAMNVGETVVAIGSPLGLNSTVTSGIVSALDRPVTTGVADESSYINAVQTDAAINPGNSGGPLVNLRGQVVGVNSAIATTGGFAGRSGNIGVGFAIPMEQVRITATQILRTGEAKYPVIGANVNIGGPESEGADGAEVVRVPNGTPADEAGLEEGDVVVAVDDVTVTDGIGLIVAIRSNQPGETITLRVDRDGREVSLQVELDAEVG